ncbi:MAG: hypothetical protein QG608_860 [Actinomycetota bacterium]|nr:hypothetical protein [Actinomycetota bacterium]
MRTYLSSTPGRLRTGAVLCAVTALFFGGAGFLSFQVRSQAQAEAHHQTEQAVGFQEILTQVLQADARSTNTYLRGGLEPVGQRADHDAALSDLSRGLVEACGNDAAARERLAEVNASLTLYTEASATARANNRQGFPVASAYLRQASEHLRKGIAPELEALAASETGRSDDSFEQARWSSRLFLLFGLTALGVLLCFQWRLARSSHRVLNLPMLVATLGVLTALGGGTAMMTLAQQKLDDLHEGSYSATIALSRARVAGFDAKALESLILIARGGADEDESRFDQRMDQIEQSLTEANRAGTLSDADPVAEWLAVHERIRTLDRAGDWDAAVELAATDSSTGAESAFLRFSQSVGSELSGESARMSSQFRDAESGLDLAGAGVLLSGILAGGFAWWGFSLRREEYR